ncbi:MAG: GNAT family N-acetyltransferase, partial [Acidobacteriota bacterium]
RYVGHWQLRGYGMWAVVERESTRVIGHMGFLNPEGGRGLELGWALEQSVWGRGYALEGARAAVEYGFSTMHAELIRCVIRGENVRSIRLAERLGARLESEFAEANGRYLVYGLASPKPGPDAGRPLRA